VRHHLSSGSINRRIFGAILTIGGASSIYYLAMTVRELVLAASFGTGDALDAYLVAVSIPLFVVTVLAGSFATALIPMFVQVREREGAAASQRTFSEALTLGAVLLVVVAVLLAIGISFVLPILASGFSPAKLSLTRQLFYVLLPIVVLSGLATMWNSVLNAGEQFALPALSPVLVPLASVVALLFGGTGGILALAIGTTIGFALQLGLVGWGLRRQGISFRPRWPSANPAVRQVIGQYLPLTASAALLSGTMLVDQAVAATLESGSVSTLAYGRKVVALVLGFGAGALGTAVTPYFSRMAAVSDWNQVRQTVITYRGLILLVAMPLTGLLYFFAEPVVAVAFQRGAFTDADTMLVAQVQAMYALQIPFFGLALLYSRLLSSIGANYVLMWSTAIGFVANVALDIVLARAFGVAGIALATCLVNVFAFGFLSIMFHRTLGRAALQNAAMSPQ
jgi:putative peptidoglycan lipid II flippase